MVQWRAKWRNGALSGAGARYASVVEAPLTTVRQPIAEMCEFIAGEVVSSFENGAPVSGRTFEAELVVRQSA